MLLLFWDLGVLCVELLCLLRCFPSSILALAPCKYRRHNSPPASIFESHLSRGNLHLYLVQLDSRGGSLLVHCILLLFGFLLLEVAVQLLHLLRFLLL